MSKGDPSGGPLFDFGTKTAAAAGRHGGRDRIREDRDRGALLLRPADVMLKCVSAGRHETVFKTTSNRPVITIYSREPNTGTPHIVVLDGFLLVSANSNKQTGTRQELHTSERINLYLLRMWQFMRYIAPLEG